MPHLSKYKVNKSVRKKLESQVLSFLSETSSDTRENIFREIITHTERIMIAKRLAILLCIFKQIPTHEIGNLLRVSPSTVARYELAIENGRYTKTIQWLRGKDSKGAKIIEFLLEFASIPFEARGKSLNQILKKY